jgi:SAM-dependent methyltransferase/uncharacterized protein YbaR (Trm112 family)
VRRGHFEKLQPVCPVCRAGGAETGSALKLAHVAREENGHIIEGALHCSNPNCLREYPIIDGIPLLVANIRQYITDNILPIYARRDLSDFTEGMLGDCCGPNSALDQSRQHLSSYVWDHYGEFDLTRPHQDPVASSAVQSLSEALQLSGAAPDGPALDFGCSAGRSSFELAARGQRLVLGVDLHFPMLRLAGEVLRKEIVRYPRRRTGLVYDWREFPVRFPGSEQVDFWACDATALPFPSGAFALAVGLNVLDCVSNPRELLVSLSQALKPAGKVLLTCPYDWSPGATPLENWLGGHSQRSQLAGAPDAILRAILTPGAHSWNVPGLKLIAERDRLPWNVRLHDRSTMRYEAHLLIAERSA